MIQKYYDASQFGEATVPKGAVGKLYGIPVISSTQVPVTNTDYAHNMLAHKEAFVHATQTLPGSNGKVRLQSNYMPDYLSTLSTADVLYGVAENRDNAAVEIQAIK